MRKLARFDPWWIEEPTSPDDVLGHAAIARAIAPIGVATGEHCQNRVVFKQLLQANAIRFCQIDSCRLGRRERNPGRAADGGEVRRSRLSARRRRRPLRVRPAPVDLRLRLRQRVARGPAPRIRRSPARALRRSGAMKNGRYMPPNAPGYSITMKPESLDHDIEIASQG